MPSYNSFDEMVKHLAQGKAQYNDLTRSDPMGPVTARVGPGFFDKGQGDADTIDAANRAECVGLDSGDTYDSQTVLTIADMEGNVAQPGTGGIRYGDRSERGRQGDK